MLEIKLQSQPPEEKNKTNRNHYENVAPVAMNAFFPAIPLPLFVIFSLCFCGLTSMNERNAHILRRHFTIVVFPTLWTQKKWISWNARNHTSSASSSQTYHKQLFSKNTKRKTKIARLRSDNLKFPSFYPIKRILRLLLLLDCSFKNNRARSKNTVFFLDKNGNIK